MSILANGLDYNYSLLASITAWPRKRRLQANLRAIIVTGFATNELPTAFRPHIHSDRQRRKQKAATRVGAKNLIAETRGMSADDDFFDAKVTVLSEMIKHHVKEEEQPGGMFAEAKKSAMDLQALGEELRVRKEQLQQSAEAA